MKLYDDYQPTGIVLAAGNPEAHAIFADKTMAQVCKEYKLTDEDVEIASSDVDGIGTLYSLIFNINGKQWAISLSNSLTADLISDDKYLAECMFRTGFKAKLNENKAKVHDDKGNLVLDEKRPFLNLGKPAGIRFDNVEKLFQPVAATTSNSRVPKK